MPRIPVAVVLASARPTVPRCASRPDASNGAPARQAARGQPVQPQPPATQASQTQ